MCDPALVAEAMYWQADTLVKAVENEQAKAAKQMLEDVRKTKP